MGRLARFRSRWLVNPSRVRIARLNRSFAREVTADMYVLDAGCGKAPYRKFFEHAHYETADFAMLGTAYAPLTYVCDLTAVPVEDGRFDRIVFNQVLEHVPDPAAVVAELARITKDGGQIICTCPFFFAPHQIPYDYYRYTTFALRRLFEQSGFEVTKLKPVEGYFAAVSYQFSVMRTALPRRVRGHGLGWRVVVVGPVVMLLRWSAFWLAGLFARVDLRWKYTARGFPKNYVVVATRARREVEAGAA
jgi:SAM-dependent methyltransferase